MDRPSFVRHWMYFGTRGYETPVPMPASGADMSRNGYEVQASYIEGGAGGYSSKAGAKVFQFNYNDAKRSELIPIIDFAEGVYDTKDGVNLIYFVTPDAADYNALPQNWAHPALEDGMPLWWDNRPTLIPTAPNSLRYPARTARYRADGPSEQIYIPVPPGYTAWVGAHGSASGTAGVRVTPVVGDATGTPTTLTMLSVINPVRVNASFDRNDTTCTGIVIDLLPTGILRNLARNPSFETDLNYTGTVPGGSGVSILTRQAGGYSGGFSARQTWSVGPGGTAIGLGTYQDIPVEAGKTYSFGAYLRTSFATRVNARLTFLDASGAVVGSASGAGQTTAAAPAWGAANRVTLTGVLAPGGAVTARVLFGTSSGTGWVQYPNGSWLEIDALQTNEGTTLQAYQDGNQTGWEWTGAVNDSASRQSPDTIQLSGMIVQLLPTGVTPAQGGFLSGQGHSGCQFLGAKPKYTVTSAPLDLVQLSAKLTETGAWL